MVDWVIVTASGANFEELVRGLCAAPTESESVEFKMNRAEPGDIGTYLSALSNAAALLGEPYGYLVWGVADQTHAIEGTTFVPEKTKKGGEDLVAWLTRGLNPQRWFKFTSGEIDNKRVVLLEIEAAQASPTSFVNERWIRVGSYRKKLEQYPATEKQLWLTLLDETRRSEPAKTNCSVGDVLALLDVAAFLRLTNRSDQIESVAQIELLEAQRLASTQSNLMPRSCSRAT